jgi:NAD(P)H dehydrogenase (quinone)
LTPSRAARWCLRQHTEESYASAHDGYAPDLQAEMDKLFWCDGGVFVGKRAMCAVTVGGLGPVYSEQGINGPISSILFPINHGIFGFTGFTVIEPFVVYGPARIGDEERGAYLARYRERILGLEQIPPNVGHIRNVRDTGDTRRT